MITELAIEFLADHFAVLREAAKERGVKDLNDLLQLMPREELEQRYAELLFRANAVVQSRL